MEENALVKYENGQLFQKSNKNFDKTSTMLYKYLWLHLIAVHD